MTPVYQSLHRHDLVLGGERDLMLLSGLVAFMTFLGGLSLASSVGAVVWWVAASAALRRMAKVDPMMSQVWLRHIRQQLFYPAHATPWQRAVRVKV